MTTSDGRLVAPPTYEDAGGALDRLIGHARGDHGGARRIVDFLFAWWNGPDLGHFPVMHLVNVDRAIARDMILIMTYLAETDVWYADAWGRRADMEGLIDRWRDAPS